MDQPLEQDAVPPPQTFDVAPKSPTAEQFSLAPVESIDVLPPDVADPESFRVEYGLGSILQKSRDEIYNGLVDGVSGKLRDQAASEIDYRKKKATQDAVANYAKNKGGVLGPDDIKFITTAVDTMNEKTDPNTVFEASWAKEYLQAMSRTAQRERNLATLELQKQEASVYANELSKGEELATKVGILRTLGYDAKKTVEDQSNIGYAADFAKGFVPFYPNVKMGTGFFMGSNLQRESLDLWRLPTKQFAETVKAKYESIKKDNPQQAEQWLDYMSGLSTSDVLLNNVFPLIDLATLPGIKLGAQAVKALGVKAGLVNEFRGAQKSMIKKIETAEPSPANIQAAAGNVKEAAITEVTNDSLIAAAKNEPLQTQNMAKDLPTSLRTDIAAIEANPGGYTDAVNRIKERWLAVYEKLDRALFDKQTTERLPVVLTREASMRAIWDDLAERLVGASNRILDWLPYYKERTSGQWYTDAIIGDRGGKYFFSREQAEGFAAERGWLNPVVESKAGVPITNPALANLSENQLKRRAKLQEAVHDIEEVQIPQNHAQIDAAEERLGELSRLQRPLTDAEREERRAWEKAMNEGYDALNIHERIRAKHLNEINGGKELRIGRNYGSLKYTGEDEYGPQMVFSTKTPGGNVDFNLKFDPDSRIIHIDTIAKEGYSVYDSTDTINALGPAKVRQIIRDLQQIFPSAVQIEGFRATGARAAAGATNDASLRLRPTFEPSATIEQQGVGYYIKLPRPVIETSGVVRSEIEKLTQDTSSATFSPRGWANAFFGKYRTPDEVLSHAQRQNREAATYGASILIDLVNESVQDINSLLGWKGIGNQQRRKDWLRVVEGAIEATDPDTGRLGRFFKDPQDLADFYQTHIGRLPDDREVRAYFAFKQTMELDRMFRNVSEFRNRARVGGETFEFFTTNEAGEKKGTGKFTAVPLKNIPTNNANILIIGRKEGQEQLLNTSKLSDEIRTDLEQGLQSGRLVAVEDYAPEHRRLSNFSDVAGNNKVRYIIGDSSTREALTWEHIPRRGGGHVVYDYGNYVKQAIIKEETVDGITNVHYENDRTIMPVAIRAMGEDIARKLDTVREFVKNNQFVEAEKFMVDNKFPVAAQEVLDWFKPSRDANGKSIPAMLNTRTRIQVVPNGKRISDMSKELEDSIGKNFVDGTKSGSLNKQYMVEYAEERADSMLSTWVDKGTKGNPLYDVQPADRLDPITSMNRALQRIIRTNYFDDYKIFSVEHWLAEANQYLKADITEIRHSPFWHFKNALTDFRAGVPEEIKARLEAQHFQINQLIGIPSETNSLMQRVSQKLADSIYTTLGPKGELLQPTANLPLIRDPLKFIRSAVFHTNLGLFNLPQFLAQSMNFVNVMGIAGPKYALAGAYGAQLHFWSTVNRNPEILRHLDTLATKLNLPGMANWRPGEFTEAMQEMQRTGFGNVGRETALLDDVMSQKVTTSLTSPVLNAGTIFYEGGTRNSRYVSWYTAFKEFRDANPVGKITDAQRAQILERADLLDLNMSRASSSLLHTGIMSIPAQFYTYQLRMSELFLGSRLTWKERARLILTNAAFFGAPAAAGITGIPLADSIRQHALENGYQTGEDFIKDTFMTGLPQTMMAWINGGGDYQKGAQFNFSDRFSTKGFDTLTSFMRGDKTIWDILGGAAYAKITSTIEQTDGFRAAMMRMIRGGPDFPWTLEDVVDVAKEINAVKATWGTIAALNTGRLISKKEIYMTDVSPMNAILMGITGTAPQDVSDVQRKVKSIKEQKALEGYIEKQFTQEFQRFVHAHKDNNPDQAQKFLARAKAFLELGSYPQDKITNLISKAAEDNMSLIQRIDWGFYLSGPDAQRKTRLETLQTRTKNNVGS